MVEVEAKDISNLDAEMAYLSCLLNENEVWHRTADKLQGQHFYDPVNRSIFEAASELIKSGKSADIITLKRRFESDERLTEIGGMDYLAGLASEAYPLAASLDYADIIRDTAKERGLNQLGLEMGELAKNPDLSADDKIGAAEKRLFELGEAGAMRQGFVHFQESLESAAYTACQAYERDGELAGLSTGLIDLDRKLGGLHPSDLIILAGRPSMGKSALAMNMAFNAAKDGKVVGVFSLEMSDDQLAMRLVAEHTGIPSDKIRRGDTTEADIAKVRAAMMDLKTIPLHIDDTGGITIGQLSARARRLKRLYGLDLLVVDYLQLVRADGRHQGRVQEITEITMGLKALAKDLDVPVLALSQLSRAVEQRDDKRPQLSDLRESGSIEQDADAVCFLYRHEYYLERQEPKAGSQAYMEWEQEMLESANQADFIIGKQRHGPIGTVKLHFQAELTKFSNLQKWGHQ